MISQKRLKEVLSYNPRDGEFIWIKPPPGHSEKMHKKAGALSKARHDKKDSALYRYIFVDGKSYGAHRLAWMYCYNEEPKVIDHINGNTLDNSIKNLRNVCTASNSQNHNYTKRANKTSDLPLGVREYVRKTVPNKYEGRIMVNDISFYSTFSSAEEASNFYCALRYLLHEFPAKKHLARKEGVKFHIKRLLSCEGFVTLLKKEGMFPKEEVFQFCKNNKFWKVGQAKGLLVVTTSFQKRYFQKRNIEPRKLGLSDKDR